MAKVYISSKPNKGIDKEVIGVWSVKGGVGKTIISIALAYELAKKQTTGLLDADLTSPNVYSYLGIEERLVGNKEKNIIYPIRKENLEIVSMGNLIGDSPVFWRGAILSNVLEDFFKKVEWRAKRIVVDLPPGTSDVLITTMDVIKPKAVLLVISPSPIAEKELNRSLEFLKRFEIPVLGIVENMVSPFYPSQFSSLLSIPYSKEIADCVFSKKPINEVVDFSPIVKRIEKGFD